MPRSLSQRPRGCKSTGCVESGFAPLAATRSIASGRERLVAAVVRKQVVRNSLTSCMVRSAADPHAATALRQKAVASSFGEARPKRWPTIRSRLGRHSANRRT